MRPNEHCLRRMNQRGITKDMVYFTLENGEVDGDRWYLDRRGLNKIAEILNQQLRMVKKLRDKGGLVVVGEGEEIKTTYDYDSRRRAY